MEKPVKFLNKKNQQLYGIIHIPEDNLELNKREGVILVHSGADGRMGYGCQYVHYARRLSQEGFYVFRFDPHGMGDSEGYIASCSWSSLWSVMQTGFYIDDVLTSIDFFIKEENIEKITLMGLCAGAVSSILAAGKDKRVNKLILIGMPVFVDDILIDYQGEIATSDYRWHLIKYIHKVTSFESWKRFLTLKTDYRRILQLVNTWFGKAFSSSAKSDYTKDLVISDNPNLNKYILASFLNLAVQRKQILFIYGTNDMYWKEFQNEFQTKYLSQSDRYNSICEIFAIKNANHTLTQKKWQDDAIEKILNWL